MIQQSARIQIFSYTEHLYQGPIILPYYNYYKSLDLRMLKTTSVSLNFIFNLISRFKTCSNKYNTQSQLLQTDMKKLHSKRVGTLMLSASMC